MIKVIVVRDAGGKFKSMDIYGHAGFADYGKDIVCAGVSALVETCILGFENVAGFKPRIVKEESFLSLEVPSDIADDAREKACIIAETILMGLKDMSDSYPEYVRMKTKKEVL